MYEMSESYNLLKFTCELYFSVLQCKELKEVTQLSCLLALEALTLFAQPYQCFSSVLNFRGFESTKLYWCLLSYSRCWLI